MMEFTGATPEVRLFVIVNAEKCDTLFWTIGGGEGGGGAETCGRLGLLLRSRDAKTPL